MDLLRASVSLLPFVDGMGQSSRTERTPTATAPALKQRLSALETEQESWRGGRGCRRVHSPPWPTTLAKVCRRVGFAGVSWEESQSFTQPVDMYV